MHRLRSFNLGLALLAVVAASAPLVAQDTAKGVRIGLRYDPGTRPGVAVLPISGAYGDSVRAILERDFDFSDRLAVVTLTAADGFLLTGETPAGAPVPLNYPLFAKVGAAAVVQVTPRPTRIRANADCVHPGKRRPHR